MKKRGILNAQLAGCIAGLGHKDLFMIGDAGMPIPEGVEVVDLVLTAGVPTFKQVMEAVLDETYVEGYYLAHEIREFNPELEDYIKDCLKEAEVEYMPHEDLKRFSGKCRFAIRTGEFSPYPSVVLRAGVVY
ncbi:MAG: D-ribose pyranase [Eubacteriales bacterium]|nr:D-ribose pyranase [Eubacteriales bacterium]